MLADLATRLTWLVAWPSRAITRAVTPHIACPVVMADARQVGIVADNLINNAIEAMPEGGTLTLGCRPDGDAVVLRVADTGQGIPPEIVPALFTPFATTKPDGTGIGLAICRRIIEAHGGTISFDTAEGRRLHAPLNVHQPQRLPAFRGGAGWLRYLAARSRVAGIPGDGWRHASRGRGF